MTEKQEEIIKTAANLIQWQGVQNFTMRNLAKRLGVTEGAIYRHFKNKRTLLEAMASEIVLFCEDCQELLKQADNQNFIKECFCCWSDFSLKKPDLCMLLLSPEFFIAEQDIYQKIMQAKMQIGKQITDFIKNEQQQNRIHSKVAPDFLTIIIIGSIRVLLKKWHVADGSFSLSSQLEKMYETIHSLLYI